MAGYDYVDQNTGPMLHAFYAYRIYAAISEVLDIKLITITNDDERLVKMYVLCVQLSYNQKFHFTVKKSKVLTIFSVHLLI